MARSADPAVLRHGRRLRLLPGHSEWRADCPTIARCVRSRMPYGLPNDPVMISLWPSPALRWASRWCTATRLRSVTAAAAAGRGQRRVPTQRHNLGDRPLVNVYLARERARRGDRDEAIPLMRAAVDQLVREGQLLAWGTPATGVLVETLLDRAAGGDAGEAEAAIDRLAAAPADDGLVIRDIWLLRLRALLARARGRRGRLPRLSGSLPRHGDLAGLRGPYELGRGDAMRPVATHAVGRQNP